MGKTIAKIYIEGTIEKKNGTYNQDWLLKIIKTLTESKKFAALVVYINSPGGSVYESDEVYLALKKYQEKTKNPVYAYFASLAASGGYYIGCGANKIFASRNTLTGSIGVISGRFVDLTELLKKYGIKSETIHAGKNKTMGSITEPATKEQKAIMQSIADECYEQFTGIVAENRNLPIETVKKLADGRIYSAKQAKDLGLIDEISSFDDFIEAINKDLFNKKDFKAPVKEFKYKKKSTSLIGLLKDREAKSGIINKISDEILGLAVPFPAFYWDGQF